MRTPTEGRLPVTPFSPGDVFGVCSPWLTVLTAGVHHGLRRAVPVLSVRNQNSTTWSVAGAPRRTAGCQLVAKVTCGRARQAVRVGRTQLAVPVGDNILPTVTQALAPHNALAVLCEQLPARAVEVDCVLEAQLEVGSNQQVYAAVVESHCAV